MFISFLYMFRAIMCPSSGEITVSRPNLVFVTLCGMKVVLHTRTSYAKHSIRSKIKWFIPTEQNNIRNHQYLSVAVYDVYFMLLCYYGINHKILF